MRQRRRRLSNQWLAGATLAVVVTAVAATTLPAPTAGVPRAAAADAAPKLTVQAGVRSWYDPGDHVVVTATVEASSLFSGSLDVAAFGSANVSQRIDVAGGTTKTVRLVVPTNPQFVDDNGLVVQLTRGSDSVAEETVRLKVADVVEIVGVLPAVATRAGKLPEQVELASDTGTAQVIALPVELVELGASALEVYDTIAATSADLTSLPAPARSALLAWLNRGGRLLLDDAANLSVLPAQWRPDAAGYALAGQGEVRVAAGAISEGKWATLIEPTGSSASESGGFFGGEMLGQVQSDLARRSGVSLPSMKPVIIPLVVYCVLVSLGLFILLKVLRRMTLAWLAIPVLAALTAGGIVVAGSGWRQVSDPSASAFVDGYPGGGQAQLSMLTFSRDGGTERVRFPANWHGAIDANFFNGGISSLVPTVRSGSESTEVSVRLEAGQVTIASVTGPTADVGLTVSASVRDNDVVGVVSNDSPQPLTAVAVFSPGGVQLVGDLAPGDSAEFAIDADPLPVGFSLFERAWLFDNAGQSTEGGRAAPETGIWGVASTTTVLYPSGMVRAAGWTNARPADGVGLATRTVVTSLAPITSEGGALPGATVRSQIVRSPFGMFGNGLGDIVYRFVTPPDTTGNLVLEVPFGAGPAELWNGTAWIKAVANDRLIAVPAPAVRNGVVMMRISPDNGFFDPSQRIILRGVTAKDDL